MKLAYTYVVINKKTEQTVGAPVLKREQARELKRSFETHAPNDKFAIVQMIPWERVR